MKVVPVAAQFAPGGDHTMAGNGGVVAVPHDVADRPMGAGPAGRSGDVTVGRNTTVWNPSDHKSNARRKIFNRQRELMLASSCLSGCFRKPPLVV